MLRRHRGTEHMIRACFFDLDGTLQDSEVLWVEASRQYLRDLGVELAPSVVQDIVYGHGWGEVFQGLARHAPALSSQGWAATADALRLYYLRLCDAGGIAIPGSVALLRRLARTVPVAIVSGATRHDIAASIGQLGIGDCLQFFIGAEDYGTGKPCPDCYRLAAERLRTPPADCLVFEDSTAGVNAAKAAGMRCVALALPGHPAQDLRGADLILPDLGSFQIDDLDAATERRHNPLRRTSQPCTS